MIQRLLFILAALAIVSVLMLGIAFAAPGGTVILDPPAVTKSGLPGTTVTYTLCITNAGGTTAITDAFTLTSTGNQWRVSLPVTQVQLSGNASVAFNVLVTIPSKPTKTSDVVTMTVYQKASTQVLTSQLTTQFFQVHLTNVLDAFQDPCRLTGESYGSIGIPAWKPSPPAETHPDLNLAVRSYTPTTAYLGLVDIGGDTEPSAPQLASVFVPTRTPNVKATYQVYGWDWDCNCRIGPISPPEDPEVTLIDLAAAAGELVRVPDRLHGNIGDGYKVMVLYASPERITLKYTREDNVVYGYTIHLENVCVDANLLALYRQLNNEGRHSLPALTAGQAVGRARSDRVGVAIRDTGTFMDPRSRKDWWHGY